MSEDGSNKLVIESKHGDGNHPLGNAEPTGDNAKSKREFSIEIFRIIRNAQKQHGLRHGDYQRYRGKCNNCRTHCRIAMRCEVI